MRRVGGQPEPIGKLLAGDTDAAPIGPKGLWLEAQVRKAWPVAVGEQVAAHAHVKRLRGKSLEVGVDSDAWGTELRYLSTVVMTKINATMGREVVTEIVVHRARKSR